MLKVLIQKQFTEMFRSFFYDQKKNRARSKGAIIGTAALFFFLMFVVMGAVFGFLAYSLIPLCEIGYAWLYFAVLGGAGVVYGVIGSVFNTYSGLYLATDNDLLLSLPIPPRTIVTARTLSVYLMGLLYSAAVTLPAAIVYFLFVPQTPLTVIGAILMIFLVSAIDFVLACFLGWAVAKIASKLKNRSYFVVILSLLFMGAYYFLYFKASDIIASLVANAALYGGAVKGKAYPVYLFGRVGEGDPLAIALYFVGAVLLVVLAVLFLSRTFFKIAAASQNSAARGKVKKIGVKSRFGTLVSKEFARFFSSATYMLNGALSTLLLPLLGVAACIKGGEIRLVLDSLFSSFEGGVPVAAICVICFLISMNLLSASAVSMEGKSLWIEQSLPVDPQEPLFAKLVLHLLLTTPPALFCSVLVSIGLKLDLSDAVFVVAVPFVYSVLTALFGLFVGTVKPLLDWTREIVPVKQNPAVFLAMLFNTACVLVFGGVYFLWAHSISTALYSGVFICLYLIGAALLFCWTATRGAKRFSRL